MSDIIPCRNFFFRSFTILIVPYFIIQFVTVLFELWCSKLDTLFKWSLTTTKQSRTVISHDLDSVLLLIHPEMAFDFLAAYYMISLKTEDNKQKLHRNQARGIKQLEQEAREREKNQMRVNFGENSETEKRGLRTYGIWW